MDKQAEAVGKNQKTRNATQWKRKIGNMKWLTTHWRSGRHLMIFFPRHYRQQKESISNGSGIPYCIANQSFLNMSTNDWNNSITKRIDCTI